MEVQSLQVHVRENTGTGGSRRVRTSGAIPVVLYGGNKEPVNLKVNSRVFEKLIHGRQGEHAVVKLEVAEDPGLNSPAVIKAVQHHPVRGHVIHADFLRIDLSERLVTKVPIVLKGNPVGVVDGGMLDHQLREIEVECMPTQIPDEIVVDVSGIKLGESVHVDSITAPPGVTIVTEHDRTIANVLVPRGVKTAEEEAAEAEAVAEAETGEAAE